MTDPKELSATKDFTSDHCLGLDTDTPVRYGFRNRERNDEDEFEVGDSGDEQKEKIADEWDRVDQH